MSRDLALLAPAFRERFEALVERMESAYTIEVRETVRSPWQQARAWRRSRTSAQVAEALAMLRRERAYTLAGYLESVGPQAPGPWATNALPGVGPHAYGLACDVYVNGDESGSDPGYAVLSAEAREVGLRTGYHWRPRPDVGHVESLDEPPRLWLDRDAAMLARFGESEAAWLARGGG